MPSKRVTRPSEEDNFQRKLANYNVQMSVAAAISID